MKTTITIYEKTHRDACLEGVTDGDIKIYDDNINDYFDYLISEAKKANIQIEIEDNIGGRSYTTEGDPDQQEEADRFMQSIHDFWSWYN